MDADVKNILICGLVPLAMTGLTKLGGWIARESPAFIARFEFRKRNLERLKILGATILRFETFGREEELEAQSKIVQYMIYCLQLAAIGLLVSAPILLIFNSFSNMWIASDAIHTLKPDFPITEGLSPKFVWSSRIYGLFMGTIISCALLLSDQAVWNAKSLSGVHRKKMLEKWYGTRDKIETKLGLPLTERGKPEKAIRAKA